MVKLFTETGYIGERTYLGMEREGDEFNVGPVEFMTPARYPGSFVL